MIPRTSNTEFTEALKVLTRHLALRDHSVLELQQKLSKRFSAELIADVLNEAARKGWLQDEREMAARAALVWQRKLKSRVYIEEQLRKRGLPLPPPDEELELATMRGLLVKKFGEPEQLTPEQRDQAIRFLKYRGFEDHTIRMVLNAES